MPRKMVRKGSLCTEKNHELDDAASGRDIYKSPDREDKASITFIVDEKSIMKLLVNSAVPKRLQKDMDKVILLLVIRIIKL